MKRFIIVLLVVLAYVLFYKVFVVLGMLAIFQG
jgi:hypothetical protein